MGLKIVSLMLYLFLYIHVFACIWYYFCRSSEKWVLNMDFIWYDSIDTYEVYFKEDFTR